jgi:Ni,Fe-hydrogenase III small subunit
MLNVIKARLEQGYRTMAYPARPPVLPARFRGLPVVDPGLAAAHWDTLEGLCPTRAIVRTDGQVRVDLGLCVFCGACAGKGISFSTDHRLATRTREDLKVGGREYRLAAALDGQMKRLFGRSLKLREVSAAGCNACEADTNVLNTLAFDLGRFGIQFVASPRHADGLLITGPVSENMAGALRKTYEAVPSPRVVIAVGACAISGGLYAGHPETRSGAGALVPVDLFIPGCPPHPLTILDGLLRFLGRL